MAIVILVRHGQTEWNRIERFRGCYDVPLNEAGLAQAKAAARAIAARWPATAVYSSPLSRALATAEPIAHALGVAVQAHPGLVDIDYGAWQGLTPAEVLSRWPEAADAWYRGAAHAPIPGGEQLSAVGARALSALRDIAALHGEQTLVAVSHTVVNRALLICAMGLPWESFWRLGQDNGAINVLEVRDDIFALLQWNGTCHLQRRGVDSP
jgi:broad specificity phosphatase PhoE